MFFSRKKLLHPWAAEEEEEPENEEGAATCSGGETEGNGGGRSGCETRLPKQQPRTQRSTKRAKRDGFLQASPDADTSPSQARDLDQLVSAFQDKWRAKFVSKAKTVEIRCVHRVQEAAQSVRQLLIDSSNSK